MEALRDTSLDADLARLLDMPALASVKILANALVTSLLEELPDPAAVDPRALLMKCAGAVVLAEQEGQRKMEPLANSKERLVEALERRIAGLEDDLLSLEDETSALRAVAMEQESLLVVQAKALDNFAESASLRELRLPH
jgi:urease accessory protein UreE